MEINRIELRHLRCLVALAEELNFGRAAERLHMSQPPLTRLIADVEKTLGAKLFARTTRRVALTPVGEVFAAEAQAVLSRVEEALESVTAAVLRQAGQLRLAYVPLALQTVLPRLLAAFRAQDHDARIDLIELLGEAQAGALASGRVDMAFTDRPIKGAGHENLLLHREPLSLLVPEAHPLAVRGSVSLEELRGEPVILHPRHEYPDYYDRIIAAYESVGVSPNVRQREPGQNCMALVIGGAGLLLVPTSRNRFQSPGLRCVGVETSPPFYAEVWAAWRKEHPSACVGALVRLAQAQFGGESGRGD